MRIAVVGTSDASGLGACFLRGGIELGHETHLVAADDLIAGSRAIGLARRARLTPLAVAPRLHALRARLLDLAPDLVLVVKGRYLPGPWVNRLRVELDCPILNYYPDHPTWGAFSDPKTVESFHAYDEIIVWGAHLVPALAERGLERIRVVPFGFDPYLYRPPATALPPCREVTLIGQFYPERLAFVEAFADTRILVSGRGWKRGTVGTPLAGRVGDATYPGEEICRRYWESTANLNVLAPENAPAHNMRSFEIPASGGVMITAPTPDHLRILGPDGAVFVETPEEARAAVDALLRDPDRRLAIAATGLRRVAGHTYAARLQEIAAPWSGVQRKVAAR